MILANHKVDGVADKFTCMQLMQIFLAMNFIALVCQVWGVPLALLQGVFCVTKALHKIRGHALTFLTV